MSNTSALERLKQWIDCNYEDCGSLCQFNWRHNRDLPMFYKYPVFRRHNTSTLETSVDEMISAGRRKYCYGYSPSPEHLDRLKIHVGEQFDLVAIHKGMPLYAFKIVKELDKEEPFDDDTIERYKMLAGDNINLQIYYIDEDYIHSLKERPKKLDCILMFSNNACFNLH